jgi:hypothetical protein
MSDIKAAQFCFIAPSKFSFAGIPASDRSRPWHQIGSGIIGALLLPFLFVLAISMVPGQVLAGSSGAEARAEALTHSLVALNARYSHAKSAAQGELLDQLIETATARQQVLGELLQDEPASVLKYAFPEHVLDKMPDSVRGYIEERVELEGELEALYKDYKDGSHQLLHFLKSNGKRYSLSFSTPPARLDPGKPVRVTGLMLNSNPPEESGGSNGTLLISTGGDNIQYLALVDSNGGTSESQGGVLGEPVNPIGEQRTLVLLVNFQDTADITPYTPAQAHDAVFGTVNNFYQEASSGKTWLTGDVRGWYTLPIASTCDGNTVASEADAAAAADGIDLGAYGRIIYIMKDDASCFWAGSSLLFVYPSRAWTRAGLDPQVIAHELGHGFGLGHSNFLDCGSTILGTDCVTARDNKFDTMGSAPETGHFNAFQKEYLGWLSPQEILTVTNSGIYDLQPFELIDNVTSKAIKIRKEQDPAGQGSTWYYLEYRQALGFDSFIAGNSNVENGILVHTGQDFDYQSSLLLDMTPNSSILSFNDRSDPALIVGESYTDTASGITITTDQAETNGASVTISLGQPLCVHGNPTLALSPPESPWVSPGTPVTYEMTVSSTDSDACVMSGFYLSAAAPSGWSVELDSDTLQIAPGTSGTVNIVVTSPQTAVEGFHDITITASESDEPSYSASATATYVIEPADLTPTCTVQTPLLGVSPSSQNGNPGTTLFYTVSLTNNDNAACDTSNFDLSITSLPGDWSDDLFPTIIILSPGTTGTTTFSVTSAGTATAGSYNLQIAVSDALDPAHAKTTTATYVVNGTTPANDTQAPSTPTELLASETRKQVSLSWNASGDNTGVIGYQVWRDGAVIANTTDTVYTDRDLANNVQYEYSVDAYDAAYNVSAMSNPVTAGKAKVKGSGGGKGKGPNK